MNTFEAAIAPISLDYFLKNHWSQQFLRVDGAADKFQPLFTWNDLNQLLAQDVLLPKRLRLVLDGKALDQDRYVRTIGGYQGISPAGLMGCLGDGATLVLDDIDRITPAIRTMTANVEETFRTSVNTNLYAGWATRQGFKLHWDYQDVLIMQVDGDKEWTVHRPTRENPMEGEAPPAPQDEPVWQGVLTQGDALYIPRGWWHMARPLGQPTMHLTVTINPPTGRDYLRWLHGHAAGSIDARANLPLRGAHDDIAERQQVLLTQVPSSPASSMNAFLDHWWAQVRVRPELDFPTGPLEQAGEITDDTGVRLALTRGLTRRALEGSTIAIETAGLEATCSESLWPALGSMTSSEWSTITELSSMLDSPSDVRRLRMVLSVLSMRGALQVRSG